MFDPELPAGFQDADIETAGLVATAWRESALRKCWICTHGLQQGPPGPPSNPTTVWTCLDCGKVFPTQEAIDADRKRNLE